jgi:hypothetical protein
MPNTAVIASISSVLHALRPDSRRARVLTEILNAIEELAARVQV